MNALFRGRAATFSKFRQLTAYAVLALAAFLVYANGYQHSFQLDDFHQTQDNPAIKDLRNIPRFFVEPETMTVLRSNMDYRPLLVTSFALNHAWSGLDMWSWHLVQVALHAGCSIFLCILFARFLEWSPLTGNLRSGAAFAAALIHAVHPVNAGVVDYISARSTLQTSFFLLAALLCHSSRTHRNRFVPLAALFYAGALFPKGEALAFLGVLLLWEWLRRAQESGRPFQWRELAIRLSPYLLMTALYLAVRLPLIRGHEAAASRRWNVGPWEYFLTQLTTPWHYLERWIAPVGLIADNLVYPVARHLTDPAVLLAATGWLTLGILLAKVRRVFPAGIFCVLSGLCLMAPTSSIFPLAEMVNEHRPYLTIPLITLPLFAGGALLLVRYGNRGLLPIGVLCGGLWVAALCVGTWQRTKTFLTEESYWANLVANAPAERAELNYGRILMRKGQLDEAERYFQSALARTHGWALLHSNMATLFEHTNRGEEAQEHHDIAVANDRFTGISLFNRGCYHHRNGDYSAAIRDLTAALELSNDPFPIHAEIAKVYAMRADAESCFRQTMICYRISPEETAQWIVEITQPFWDDASRYEAGLDYYRRLLPLYPTEWWAYDNVGGMLANLDRDEEARPYLSKAADLKSRNDAE